MTADSARFSGKTVLVTGAAGGIGFASAHQLCAEGATVILADLRADALKEATSRLSASWEGQVHAVPLNVTSESSVAAAFEVIALDIGTVSSVVHCAGVARNAPLLETSLEEWEFTLTVNATGTFLIGRHAAAAMRQGGGSIVNVGSISGSVGTPGQASYAASKAAVEGLTRVMAAELATWGIRVNAVSPGPIESNMSRGMVTAETRAARIERLPLGRFGEPQEVAQVAAFLASDDASYVTGTTTVVDGGFLIGGVRQQQREFTQVTAKEEARA